MTKKYIINPADRELISCVKRAACKHFEIEEERLIGDTSQVVANIRFLCFWLIAQNCQVKDYVIADSFRKGRTVVKYGVETIDVHIKIYRQTIDNLRKIADIANNFDKNYSWGIQS